MDKIKLSRKKIYADRKRQSSVKDQMKLNLIWQGTTLNGDRVLIAISPGDKCRGKGCDDPTKMGIAINMVMGPLRYRAGFEYTTVNKV